MTARRRVYGAPSRAGEIVRIVFLAGVAAWLLHPFATRRAVGAGDALWYSNMLADYVVQGRAGIFPIFAGQSDYAFNGAVYPLRVAPLYQHVAGWIDLLTWHRLDFFLLQHCVLLLSGAVGIFSAYACLVALAPARRWEAAGLAALYLSCPGVLATVYTQDLYMTWMAVPFLPVVFFAVARSFRRDDWLTSALLAGSLAALWWAHSPVAFWATGLAFVSQVLRLIFFDRNRYAWRRACGCAALFALLAQYPFVSTKALQTPGAVSTVAVGVDQPELLARNIAAAFPADLLPLTRGAGALSDLQLGYGLWAVVGILALTLSLVRRVEIALLSALGSVLVFLLFPFPGNPWVYVHLPATVQRLTYYWPMHRLYLLLAAIVVTAGVIAFDLLRNRSRPLIIAARTLLAAGCMWSLFEARQFVRAGRERRSSDAQTAQKSRPENRLLMNHAYGLFSALPPYFSNGTMSAESETRLLSLDTGLPLHDPSALVLPTAGGPDAQSGEWHPLQGHPDDNPGIIKMDTGFVLQPGLRYELSVVPRQKTAPGIFQIAGPTFFREYVLPSSGQSRAFGSADGNSSTIPLWTTATTPEKIILRFIPTAPGANPTDFQDFGLFAIRELHPETAPVQLLGLMPFHAQTRASIPTVLETPRMYQPGYLAVVDGTPATVTPTPAGLAAVALTAGNHDVTLRFVGSLALRFSYSLSLTLWAFFLTVLPTLYLTRYRRAD